MAKQSEVGMREKERNTMAGERDSGEHYAMSRKKLSIRNMQQRTCSFHIYVLDYFE